MTPQERAKRVRELFDLMLDAPAAARAEMLREACGGDESLRAEVMGLLQTAGESGMGARVDLSRPAVVLADVLTTAGAEGSWRDGLELAPGTRIGPYELRGVLGMGGFGVVYEAERREPFVQRVALKVIKPGMDSGAVIARFEQERQTLAVMDHPNVARVIDGGVTAPELGSRPYFVMELVEGEPITAYCDRRRLTIRQRLELFITVCDAVQHAHMRGIIHRDLKPSNVLVRSDDGTERRTDGGGRIERGGSEAAAGSSSGRSIGLVKVIDFGVAKAISHGEVERATFTQQGLMIGTPEYMSPEQAVGAADIDTRTDVYSLGVLLYELLTGALPFDPESLRSAGMEEIRRIIREHEPPTPSGRVSLFAQAQAERVALARGVNAAAAASLARELKRELEWVPLKAMRKERERRYGSAAEFAEDVRRYLRGEALDAGPESRGYRVRKFVGRHRVGVGAGVAVAGALVVGFLVAVILLRETERQRRAASSLAEFLNRDVLAAAGEYTGPETRATDLMTRALRQASTRLRSEPAAEARVRATIGRSLLNLGALADAQRELEVASRVLARVGGVPSDEREALEVALAECAWRQFDERLDVERVATDVDRLKERWGKDDCRVLDAEEGLASALKNQNRLDEAEVLYRDILSRRERAATCDAVKTEITRRNLAFIILRRGDLAYRDTDVAVPLWRKAAAELRESQERMARIVEPGHPELLSGRVEVAKVLSRLKQFDEAMQEFRAVVPEMRTAFGPTHWRFLEALAYSGRTMLDQGDIAGAIAALTEAAVGYTNVRGADHQQTRFVIGLLASAHAKAGNKAEAERLRALIASDNSRSGQLHPAKNSERYAKISSTVVSPD